MITGTPSTKEGCLGEPCPEGRTQFQLRSGSGGNIFEEVEDTGWLNYGGSGVPEDTVGAMQQVGEGEVRQRQEA